MRTGKVVSCRTPMVKDCLFSVAVLPYSQLAQNFSLTATFTFGMVDKFLWRISWYFRAAVISGGFVASCTGGLFSATEGAAGVSVVGLAGIAATACDFSSAEPRSFPSNWGLGGWADCEAISSMLDMHFATAHRPFLTVTSLKSAVNPPLLSIQPFSDGGYSAVACACVSSILPPVLKSGSVPRCRFNAACEVA